MGRQVWLPCKEIAEKQVLDMVCPSPSPVLATIPVTPNACFVHFSQNPQAFEL